MDSQVTSSFRWFHALSVFSKQPSVRCWLGLLVQMWVDPIPADDLDDVEEEHRSLFTALTGTCDLAFLTSVAQELTFKKRCAECCLAAKKTFPLREKRTSLCRRKYLKFGKSTNTFFFIFYKWLIPIIFLSQTFFYQWLCTTNHNRNPWHKNYPERGN